MSWVSRTEFRLAGEQVNGGNVGAKLVGVGAPGEVVGPQRVNRCQHRQSGDAPITDGALLDVEDRLGLGDLAFLDQVQ